MVNRVVSGKAARERRAKRQAAEDAEAEEDEEAWEEYEEELAEELEEEEIVQADKSSKDGDIDDSGKKVVSLAEVDEKARADMKRRFMTMRSATRGLGRKTPAQIKEDNMNALRKAEGREVAPKQMPMMNTDAMAYGRVVRDVFGDGPITVKQRFDDATLITGCESSNRYQVDGAVAGPMYMHEESGALDRIMCGPNRELDLYLHLGTNKDAPVLLHFHKPSHCMDCPHKRANMQIYDSQQNSIGRIDDPCACLNISQRIFNNRGTLLYSTSGSQCQRGLYPVMQCLGKSDATVEIKHESRENKKDGSVVKKGGGLKECWADWNEFELNFPEGCEPRDKALLLGMAFLLDIEYFETERA